MSQLPVNVLSSKYEIKPALVKKSRQTSVENGRIGKNLSDGYAINYAIGCTFGCRFCYVDGIQKFYGAKRAGDVVKQDWGYYFSVPSNFEEALGMTNFAHWKDKEIMLCSTQDTVSAPTLQMDQQDSGKGTSPGGPLLYACALTCSYLLYHSHYLLCVYAHAQRIRKYESYSGKTG